MHVPMTSKMIELYKDEIQVRDGKKYLYGAEIHEVPDRLEYREPPEIYIKPVQLSTKDSEYRKMYLGEWNKMSGVSDHVRGVNNALKGGDANAKGYLDPTT